MRGPLGALILLLIVGVPVIGLLWFLRRPVDRVPRDAVAMKGEAELRNPVHVFPSDAGEDLVEHAADG